MRGSLKQRSKGSWSLILDLGYALDPATGLQKRRQRWHTFRGTRKDAETKLTDLLKEAGTGTYVDTSKMTLGEWLAAWLRTSVKPSLRASTYQIYRSILDKHLLPNAIATIPLQKLRPLHLESYYAALTEKGLSPATVLLHHAILHRALRKARKDHLVATNVAIDLDGKPPRPKHGSGDAQVHCWTPGEARAFLLATKEAGAQPAAFYGLALDSGMRKGELCGLRWTDVDLASEKVYVVQQLVKPGPLPIFGPTKTDEPRTISLGTETVELLRAHRQHQAEVKMANRAVYHDYGLVFAKEACDVQTKRHRIGDPLQANNLGQREYPKLIAAAGVRPIKFHGLRHTCATLLLRAGVPVKVVSERLGHSTVSMTLEIYAHVLPDMQQHAATTLSAILHG